MAWLSRPILEPALLIDGRAWPSLFWNTIAPVNPDFGSAASLSAQWVDDRP